MLSSCPTPATLAPPSVEEFTPAPNERQTGPMDSSSPAQLARLRLTSQRVHRHRPATPSETVTQLTAMQGQDLPGVLWSIGLRTPVATESDVRAAFDRRELVRSWPMRGTLHVTAPDDLRLILPLSRHRLKTAVASRHRELGITADDVTTATDAGTRALGEGPLTRKQLLEVFEAAGQSTAGQRGIHLISSLAHAGLICQGPFVGTEQAFVLFDEWAPSTGATLDRDEAIAAVALRYFVSHGPATEADFAWWANLTLTDVRAAIAAIGDRMASRSIDGRTYYGAGDVLDAARPDEGATDVFLMPGFDEQLLGYADRSAALNPEHSERIVPGRNGVFKPTLVIGGRVSGTWSRREKARGIDVVVMPFDALDKDTERALERAVEHYSRFKDKPVSVTIAAEAFPPAR